MNRHTGEYVRPYFPSWKNKQNKVVTGRHWICYDKWVYGSGEITWVENSYNILIYHASMQRRVKADWRIPCGV